MSGSVIDAYERALTEIRAALGLSVEDSHEIVLERIRELVQMYALTTLLNIPRPVAPVTQCPGCKNWHAPHCGVVDMADAEECHLCGGVRTMVLCQAPCPKPQPDLGAGGE